MKGLVAGKTAALVLALASLAGAGCGHRRGEIAELMGALGARRPVEPRLTGELAYAPCRPAGTVEGQVPDARCSALPRPGSPGAVAFSQVSKRLGRTARTATVQRLQAQGLERLILHRQPGAADRAVETLRQATSLAPKDAHVWSDLAAALYVRAQQENEPQGLLFALSAAGTAVDLAPALPEALFNRALILDRLYLRGEATAGWKRYLEVDSGSPWAREAQAHLKELRAPSVPELWKRQLPALRAAAAAGDEKMLQELVATSPQTAREYAVEEVLGKWGREVLEGKGSEAAEELRVAAGIGRALVARGGDGTVAEAVAVIERAEGKPERLATLARGHKAYAEGISPFGQLQVEDAAAPLREARDSLEPAGSPVGLWAEVGLGGVTLYAARYEEAAQAFSSALEQIDPIGFPALVGRASWGLGLTRLRQGHLSEALANYQVALAAFTRAYEAENLGTIHAWRAEVFRLLGDNGTAWKERYQALATLCAFPASQRLHTLLWEAASATSDEISPSVALVLQDEGVRVAESLGSLPMIAEALLRRSKIHAALEGVDAALTDLRNADLNLDRSPAGGVSAKLRSDVALARGETERDPRRAITFFDQALAYYRQKGLVLNLAVAELSRARASLAAGLDGEAEANLDRAIELFERQRNLVSDGNLRLSYSEAVQGLFDERILLAVKRPGGPVRALEFAEWARTVPLESLETPATPAHGAAPVAIPLAPAPAARLGRRLSVLPSDVVFVEYAWVRDRLLRWTIRSSGVELDPQPVATQNLEGRIAAFTEAVRAGSEESLRPASATLYDELVPEAARHLPLRTRLFFVPDKALHGVPFAALRNPVTGAFLLSEHAAVGVVPSVTFYLESQERGGADSDAWNALLVGNPAFDRTAFTGFKDLGQADKEIAEVGKLYPRARVLRGSEATGSRFLAGLDGQEILEYAGHAVDNPKHPAFSYLVLAREEGRPGALFAHELARQRLKKLRLVILNGCQTIAARNLRVGGFSGLARPFLDAGAQAVLGTLWDVDDDAARQVLAEFHRRFRATGDASTSLHVAQLACLRGTNKTLRLPAVWGSFQLVGAITPAHL